MSDVVLVIKLVKTLYVDYVYAQHVDLHSFPTRRSSDLRGTRPRSRGRRAPHPRRRRRSRAGTSAGTGPRRSEEHTSELQSPYDLVCRLLLEKKKSSNIDPGMFITIPYAAANFDQIIIAR